MEWTGIIQTVGALLGSVGVAALVARGTKKTAESQDKIASSGQLIDGEATFRRDILARVTALEKQLDETNRIRDMERARYEAASLDAVLKFEAREDQLLRWGTWEPSGPPRQPPVFVWPVVR